MAKTPLNTSEMIIGNSDGLRISLGWDKAPPGGTASQATWGKCNLWIGDQLVWGNEDPKTNLLEAVSWDWIELLEFLIDSIDYILYEETYPIPLSPMSPTHPGKLKMLASQRWETMPESLALKEETEIHYFVDSHDLAKGLHGVFLPSVFLLREGNQMWIGTEGHYILRPFMETQKTLEDLGNLISQRLSTLEDPRTQWAYSAWQNRNGLSPEQRLSIATGFKAEELRDLQASDTFADFWELSAANLEPFEMTELQAAARMLKGKVSSTNLSPILEKIRGIQSVKTPELDKLSQQAVEFLKHHVATEFYEQGYQLATWLRQQLGLDDHGKVAPKELLTQWGVLVQEINDLPTGRGLEALDAIACWGPRHGPAVLLNLNSWRNQKLFGRSSTYGHEICHLLVDRDGALPLVEIFGGRLPGGAERRANAFAAELLLPRSTAAEVVRNEPAPLAHLSSKYGVSYHLAANQILNSVTVAELTPEMLNYLENIRIKQWMVDDGSFGNDLT